MNWLSILLLGGSLWVLYRALLVGANSSNTKRVHEEEIARMQNVIALQPSNAGAHAQLAEWLEKDGDMEAAIHEYRTAISLLPRGPFTEKWKRKLKQLLESQEIVARGEKIPGFNEWRVCPACQAKVTTRDRSCPKCGVTLQKNFFEWFLTAETQNDIWKQAIPIALVLWICSVIFMGSPLEWKGTIIISSLIVGTYFFVKN